MRNEILAGRRPYVRRWRFSGSPHLILTSHGVLTAMGFVLDVAREAIPKIKHGAPEKGRRGS